MPWVFLESARGNTTPRHLLSISNDSDPPPHYDPPRGSLLEHRIPRVGYVVPLFSAEGHPKEDVTPPPGAADRSAEFVLAACFSLRSAPTFPQLRSRCYPRQRTTFGCSVLSSSSSRVMTAASRPPSRAEGEGWVLSYTRELGLVRRVTQLHVDGGRGGGGSSWLPLLPSSSAVSSQADPSPYSHPG